MGRPAWRWLQLRPPPPITGVRPPVCAGKLDARAELPSALAGTSSQVPFSSPSAGTRRSPVRPSRLVGFSTVITVSITSAFIETARRWIEGTTTDALSAKLDRIGARLDAIEAGRENIRGQNRNDPR